MICIMHRTESMIATSSLMVAPVAVIMTAYSGTRGKK